MLTKSLLLGVCAALCTAVLPAPAAQAAPAPGPPARPAATPPPAVDPSRVDPAARDRVLPAGWRRSSDVAWTTRGDATGFHLLVAEARTGYVWRTAATLAEPWIGADQWVGNACVTASGRRAVVVYAPRHFTNRGHLFDRGAFAAVVDLATGAVSKLDVTVSLAYYDPGCGSGETAVLTQGGAVDKGRTRLHLVDTARGRRVRTHDLPGEVTSAVPVRDRIVAARGAQLVEIDRDGGVRRLAGTSGVPYRVHPDATGGVLFTERVGATGVVKRLSGGVTRELARGPVTGIRVKPGSGGRVFLLGSPTRVSALPPSVTRLAVAVDAEVSTAGQLTVTHDAPRPGAASPAPRAEPGTPPAVALDARVTATGAAVRFRVDPADRVGSRAAAGRTASPAAAGTARAAGGDSPATAAESPTDPVDNDRTCSIPRNDPRLQVYQPHWSQVEWAADLAVQGALTITRPADWKRSGMSVSWVPQQMFRPVALSGGGRVPAQVLLGVLAQESNLWQASFHVAEGVTGNPLVGSYYGAEDGWAIDWARADCGYGVAQITDGMRRPGKGQPTLPPDHQRAVAVDYATNIAAGVSILQRKWNETYALNARVNGADPAAIESWFTALWAYNSGINPQAGTGNTSGCTPGPQCTDADGNYGLGWTNNPARPDFPADRAPFLDHDSYDDARNPQWWPYPEKVIGWAAYPIVKATGGTGYEAAYDQAWWNTEELRSGAKPPLATFCSTDPGSGNSCDPANIGRPANPCTRSDFHCWWHAGVQWKDCTASTRPCGHESDSLTPPGRPEPPDADAAGAYPDESRPRYAPSCSRTGLPAGALVVDDVPDSVPVVRPGCGRSWTSAGTFGLSFGQHTDGLYHSKVDFHQIGGGFGGHFWFTHSRTPAANATRNWAVTGTWTLTSPLDQWARVLVHLPDHGAHSQQAAYTVHLGDGRSKRRVVLQKTQRHQWVSLGAFRFAGRPSVSLSSLTEDGDGSQDIAWDAVAVVPLPGKPADQIVVLGDSYSSGEGASRNAPADYYQETDDSGTGGSAYRNGCHRSRHAWSRQLVLPGRPESVGALADRFDSNLDHHLLACSGAETENLLPAGVTNAFGDPGRGQYKEVSQLDRGFLDEDTTLVALTIGGNDARFSDLMRLCTSGTPGPLQFCQDEFAPAHWPGSGPPAFADVETVIRALIAGQVRASVETVLRRVRGLAPNARIVLMGYPRLFPPEVGSLRPTLRFPDCHYLIGLNGPEMSFLNDMSDELNNTLHEAATTLTVAGVPVSYSDPRDELELHNLCSTAYQNEIHGVVLDPTEGEDPGATVSAQSFHPTVAGAQRYATALVHTLRSRIDGAGAVIPPGEDVAAAELDELPGNPAGSATGYSRGAFEHWVNVGGCDARNAVLRREGTQLTPAGGCPVTGGRWFSPYDGVSHSSPGTLHIDHMVPLGDAWRSGADGWTPQRRRAFANDVEHPQLLAVSGSINSSKKDRSPDAWLPPETSYRCLYARSWIHTKHVWHLAVTDAEYTTLKQILGTHC